MDSVVPLEAAPEPRPGKRKLVDANGKVRTRGRSTDQNSGEFINQPRTQSQDVRAASRQTSAVVREVFQDIYVSSIYDTHRRFPRTIFPSQSFRFFYNDFVMSALEVLSRQRILCDLCTRTRAHNASASPPLSQLALSASQRFPPVESFVLLFLIDALVYNFDAWHCILLYTIVVFNYRTPWISVRRMLVASESILTEISRLYKNIDNKV